MRLHLAPALAVIAAWACAVPGCAQQMQAALAAPKRVVSTFLCTDEYVFRLLPASRIAALSYEATDRNPVVSTIADAAAPLPVIRPGIEAVLALHPDLVVMYAGVNDRLRNALKAHHIAVLDVPWANSLDDIRTITRKLGAALGYREKAEILVAEMDRKLAAARTKHPAPPVSTVFYQPNGYAMTSGYTGEIMAAAGLRDIAPAIGVSRTGRIAVETIVARAPELLILGGEERSGSALAYQVLHHPALRHLNGHTETDFAVFTELMCPGPWSVDAAARFAALGRKARLHNVPLPPNKEP